MWFVLGSTVLFAIWDAFWDILHVPARPYTLFVWLIGCLDPGKSECRTLDFFAHNWLLTSLSIVMLLVVFAVITRSEFRSFEVLLRLWSLGLSADGLLHWYSHVLGQPTTYTSFTSRTAGIPIVIEAPLFLLNSRSDPFRLYLSSLLLPTIGLGVSLTRFASDIGDPVGIVLGRAVSVGALVAWLWDMNIMRGVFTRALRIIGSISRVFMRVVRATVSRIVAVVVRVVRAISSSGMFRMLLRQLFHVGRYLEVIRRHISPLGLPASALAVAYFMAQGQLQSGVDAQEGESSAKALARLGAWLVTLPGWSVLRLYVSASCLLCAMLAVLGMLAARGATVHTLLTGRRVARALQVGSSVMSLSWLKRGVALLIEPLLTALFHAFAEPIRFAAKHPMLAAVLVVGVNLALAISVALTENGPAEMIINGARSLFTGVQALLAALVQHAVSVSAKDPSTSWEVPVLATVVLSDVWRSLGAVEQLFAAAPHDSRQRRRLNDWAPFALARVARSRFKAILWPFGIVYSVRWLASGIGWASGVDAASTLLAALYLVVWVSRSAVVFRDFDRDLAQLQYSHAPTLPTVEHLPDVARPVQAQHWRQEQQNEGGRGGRGAGGVAREPGNRTGGRGAGGAGGVRDARPQVQVPTRIFLRADDTCTLCLEDILQHASGSNTADTVMALVSPPNGGQVDIAAALDALSAVEVSALTCGHCLHSQCLQQLRSSNAAAAQACPLCREPLSLGSFAMQQLFE